MASIQGIFKLAACLVVPWCLPKFLGPKEHHDLLMSCTMQAPSWKEHTPLVYVSLLWWPIIRLIETQIPYPIQGKNLFDRLKSICPDRVVGAKTVVTMQSICIFDSWDIGQANAIPIQGKPQMMGCASICNGDCA